MAGPLLAAAIPPLITAIGGFFGGLAQPDPPEQQQRRSFRGQASAQRQMDFINEAIRSALMDSIIAQNQPRQFGGSPDPTALLSQLGGMQDFGGAQVGIAPGVAEFGKPIDFLPTETPALMQFALNQTSTPTSDFGQQTPITDLQPGDRALERLLADFGEDAIPAERPADDFLGQAAAGPNGGPGATAQGVEMSQQIDQLIQQIINQGRLI